ncbi:MAG: polysaccharide biosynthesis C-terminal domain-containing protein [Clostridia bacterium]|nr:polysaccharide biosynthesis C-terminal domain-containing protein [Clostridia bacterium]
MSKSKSIFKSFSLLAVITIVEKIIAFVFEASIAANIGANKITDGYFITAEFFTLIDSAFLSAATVVALRQYTHYVMANDEQQGFRLLSRFQSVYLPVILFVSIAVFCLAVPLSYVIAPGYSEEARSIVIRCIRFMAFVPCVSCVTSVGLAVLRQKKEFLITGLKSLFISVVGIASVFLFGRNSRNADLLSIAYAISMVLYCVLVMLFTRRYGVLKLCKPVLDNEIKNLFKKLFPLMISYGVARVALMVDKTVASFLGTGAVSQLTYAHSLYKVVGAIFVTNLTTIILTDFNNLCSRNETEKVSRLARKTISMMTLMLIPVTIVSFFNASNIVKIVYERGEFAANLSASVGSVLMFYALNFVPVMIQGIYNQALYAFGDTKKPMWISVTSVVVNLGLSIPLSFVVGLAGIAIGTVASALVTIVLQRIVLKKYLPDYKGGYSRDFLWKAGAASAVCLLAVFAVSQFVSNAYLSFGLSTIVGFSSFLIVMILLKENYSLSALKQVVAKFKK